ncbi:MAG: coproporphyrinogen-III oxidase family protein [Candidatus Aminicenantes bacterium]
MMKFKFNREHFINQYPPFNLANAREAKEMHQKEDLLIYVHIPFCPKKCGYCYYKSVDHHTTGLIDQYLDSLKKEILLFSQQPEFEKKQMKSLYLGGGTPTILSDSQYEDLVTFIFDTLNFKDDFEFCSEARPHEKSLTPAKLKLMKSLGVNRLSMGMQSLSDKILKMNQRDARLEFYYKVYQMARELEFENINIDMMSGMYGETWENWNQIIERLIRWAPPSIAIYKMELFYNVRLYRDIKERNRTVTLMSDEEEIKHIRRAHERLQKEGNYQVINCLHLVKDSKYQDIHYTSLWKGVDMKGFGLSSHSCYENFLHQNTSNFKEYHQMISEGQLPIKRAHRLSVRERISEAMVYGLKNLYINRRDFVNRFGFDMTEFYGELIDNLVEEGIVSLDDESLRIRPDYYIFADDICRLFFLPEYETMMLAHVPRYQVHRQ